MCGGMWVRVEARGFVNRCLHLTEMGEMAVAVWTWNLLADSLYSSAISVLHSAFATLPSLNFQSTCSLDIQFNL